MKAVKAAARGGRWVIEGEHLLAQDLAVRFHLGDEGDDIVQDRVDAVVGCGERELLGQEVHLRVVDPVDLLDRVLELEGAVGAIDLIELE